MPKVGAPNVEFRLGELEHLPIADNTADVISNCVIKLAAGLPTASWRWTFGRVLRGGRVA